MTEPRILTLSPHLDLRAAASLKADIEACGGAPIEIDASRVERIGAPCLQVLLAAAKASDANGHGWHIASASESFRDDVRAMGATTKLNMGDTGAGSGPC
jgi:chemotaxis protein CheX